MTKPGLDQPVGAAAINTVPRQMIRAAMEAVCAETGYSKTFNPMLGVEGGISILGTSGVVEPMSEQALVDTIAVQLRQAAASGETRLILTPGNYGLDFLRETCGALASVPVVKCSNFIGDALDIAALEGFGSVLLVGHFGKLVKLAAGVMNTHSRFADARLESITAHAALCGASTEVCRALMRQVTTDGCLAVLEDAGLREPVTASLMAAMQRHLGRRAGDAFTVGAITFSNQYGLLGMTEPAETMLRDWGAAK